MNKWNVIGLALTAVGGLFTLLASSASEKGSRADLMKELEETYVMVPRMKDKK